MGKNFNNILIPVDFSLNTEVAISKALELSHGGKRSIHLFHVQPKVIPNMFKYMRYLLAGYSRSQVNASIKESMDQLSLLKSKIEQKHSDVDVFTWVQYGESVEKSVIGKAVKLAADLIIIGKKSHHSNLPFLNTVVPGRIASASRIPVLMSKPGSLNEEIRTIVIPVDARFPISKLEILQAFTGSSKLQIRLVMFGEDTGKGLLSKQSLLNIFRTLKSQSPNPVNYEVLQGRNKATSLLTYCSKVKADMLIVYPGSETRVGVWVNSHISDLLPANSKTQVLAVNPID